MTDDAPTLPESFLQQVRGFQVSRVLLTAIELDVFTAVGEGADAQTVAEYASAPPEGVSRLLDALVSLELLSKTEGRYRNGELAQAFLCEGSPHDQRLSLLHTAHMWDRWATMTECVKAGHSLVTEEEKGWSETRRESFIAAMHRGGIKRVVAMVEALGEEPVGRSLDLGGGSGVYSAALCRAHPDLQATVMDLPEVTPITRRYVEAETDVAGRIRVVDGDVLTAELPGGNDLVLLSSLVHIFSEAHNRDLLHRVAASLNPGGRIAIQEFVLDDDRTGPLAGTLFALNMFVATEEGNAYAGAEIRAWLRAAGFKEIRQHPLGGPTSLLVARLDN